MLSHTTTGTRIDHDITPGTPLTVTVRATADVDLPRCCLQLWVHRSDGLSIFDGVSYTDGVQPVPVRAGQSVEATVSFMPNLLKGMYTIGLSLVDMNRQWSNILLPSVASFIVADNHRWGGCVELNPTYRLRASGRGATVIAGTGQALLDDVAS